MIVKSVIVAAGKGTRFGSKKQFESVGNGIVLDYSVRVLEKFGNIVIVCSKEDIEFVLNRYPKTTIVTGGKERMHSVYNGLKAIDICDIVLIHDAARPIIEEKTIEKLIEATDKYGAAILGIPAFETLKYSINGFVTDTIDRSKIVISQTPQGFKFYELRNAVKISIEKNEIYTDESAVWEKFYGKVKLVEGSRKNIKITTREDLEIARCLLG